MSEKKSSKPRITILVTQEQYDQLKLYLEYGFQKKVFSTIIDDVILMLNLYGHQFVLAMLKKQISYKFYMEKYLEKEKELEGANPRFSQKEISPS